MTAFVEWPSEESIRGRWKWFVAFGAVLVVLGLLALLNVADATLVTTILIGWLLILGGIAQVAGAMAGSGSTGWRVLFGLVGLLYAIVGFIILTDPFRGAILLTQVIAIVLVIEGAIRLVSALSSETSHRLLTGTIGVLDIVLGLWLWTAIPFSGLAIGFFVGFQMLLAGILWIMLGWTAKPATPPAPTAVA